MMEGGERSQDCLSFDDNKINSQQAIVRDEGDDSSFIEQDHLVNEEPDSKQQGAYSLLADLSQPPQNIVQENPTELNIVEHLIAEK